MKLSELASIQIHALFKKSQGLERSVLNDRIRPDRYVFPEAAMHQQHHIQTLVPPLHPPHQMFYHPNNTYFQCSAHHFR